MINSNGCDFCNKFDFSTASTEMHNGFAHICLAVCNTRFPKEKQFKFCPECGRDLRGVANAEE